MARERAIRITTAGTSRAQDIAHRQRTYLLSMGIRSGSFVLAVVTGLLHWNWVWPFFILAAIVLPYIAVVMANAARTKGEHFTLEDSPYGRPELRGGAQWRQENADSGDAGPGRTS